MPTLIPVSIFLHQRVSVGLALLADFIFNFANRLAAQPVFKVQRVHRGPGSVRSVGGVSVQATGDEVPDRSTS